MPELLPEIVIVSDWISVAAVQTFSFSFKQYLLIRNNLSWARVNEFEGFFLFHSYWYLSTKRLVDIVCAGSELGQSGSRTAKLLCEKVSLVQSATRATEFPQFMNKHIERNVTWQSFTRNHVVGKMTRGKFVSLCSAEEFILEQENKDSRVKRFRPFSSFS